MITSVPLTSVAQTRCCLSSLIPCLGRTHTKSYTLFRTERSSGTSPYRPYKGVTPPFPSLPTPETNPWKFVDDVSISECLTKNGGASIQSTLDTVSSWASMNLMKLNAKKCKELRVCFFKATPQLPPLRIDGQVLETVRSHKVLALVIQDSLKWNENTRMIVSKASKRLHIIRVLRRGGVSAADLLVIYVALVRSVLGYCCVSSEIERVQMRALRIIFPRSSYQEALQRAKIPRLEDRRNELCTRAFEKLPKEDPCQNI